MTWRVLVCGLSTHRPNGVEFIHSQKGGNLGDKLCTPKHYFVFRPSPSAGRIAVIGGGSWTSFGVELARTLKSDHKILWGVGRSVKPDHVESKLDFALIGQLFDHSSTRDPEWALNGVTFVPCVSVFHRICDIDPGNRKGFFFNASPKASGGAIEDLSRKLSEQHPDVVIGTNAMPESEFLDAFSKTKRIVTNSYHIAYWALLSGRAVTVIGYSSKFTSLMTMFHRSPSDVIPYARGDAVGFKAAVQMALADTPRT